MQGAGGPYTGAASPQPLCHAMPRGQPSQGGGAGGPRSPLGLLSQQFRSPSGRAGARSTPSPGHWRVLAAPCGPWSRNPGRSLLVIRGPPPRGPTCPISGKQGSCLWPWGSPQPGLVQQRGREETQGEGCSSLGGKVWSSPPTPVPSASYLFPQTPGPRPSASGGHLPAPPTLLVPGQPHAGAAPLSVTPTLLDTQQCDLRWALTPSLLPEVTCCRPAPQARGQPSVSSSSIRGAREGDPQTG